MRNRKHIVVDQEFADVLENLRKNLATGLNRPISMPQATKFMAIQFNNQERMPINIFIGRSKRASMDLLKDL